MRRLCFVMLASCISFVMIQFDPVQGGVALAGTRISYAPFISALYPYRLLQASSFQHIVLTDLTGRKVDYFYPALGSSVTNVNIYENRQGELREEAPLMDAAHAKRIHVSGYMSIDGKLIPIVTRDHSGLTGNWREEYVEFREHHDVWHLTMSYLVKYRAIRPTMLHMLKTFQRL